MSRSVRTSISGAGECVVEVKTKTSQDSPSLISNPEIKNFESGIIMQAPRALALIDGKVVLFDITNPNHYFKYVGISVSSGLVGEQVQVRIEGTYYMQFWGLIPNQVYYVGIGGLIVPTQPNVGVVYPIGFAEDANSLFLSRHQPILV